MQALHSLYLKAWTLVWTSRLQWWKLILTGSLVLNSIILKRQHESNTKLLTEYSSLFHEELASTGEKEWYFYCPRDRKYRNSTRPNRVTGAGFWKATGTDRPIYSSDGSKCIGLKKSLVFYKGRAAKGVKTDWMMHEFRLPSLTEPSLPSKKPLEKTIPPNVSTLHAAIFDRKMLAIDYLTLERYKCNFFDMHYIIHNITKQYRSSKHYTEITRSKRAA